MLNLKAKYAFFPPWSHKNLKLRVKSYQWIIKIQSLILCVIVL